MVTAQPPVRYEVIAKSMAFDHEMFSHGDIIDEVQFGARVYQLLRAGLIKRLPASVTAPSDINPEASSALPDAD